MCSEDPKRRRRNGDGPDALEIPKDFVVKVDDPDVLKIPTDVAAKVDGPDVLKILKSPKISPPLRPPSLRVFYIRPYP